MQGFPIAGGSATPAYNSHAPHPKLQFVNRSQFFNSLVCLRNTVRKARMLLVWVVHKW